MFTYYLCFSYFSPSYCVNLIPFSHSTTWSLQFFQTLCSKCFVNIYYGQAIMLWCYDRCTFSYHVFYFVLCFTLWNRNERRQNFHVLFYRFFCVFFCRDNPQLFLKLNGQGYKFFQPQVLFTERKVLQIDS